MAGIIINWSKVKTKHENESNNDEISPGEKIEGELLDYNYITFQIHKSKGRYILTSRSPISLVDYKHLHEGAIENWITSKTINQCKIYAKRISNRFVRNKGNSRKSKTIRCL